MQATQDQYPLKLKELRKRVFRKHFALPNEHGAWIWWIGPLLIGAAAGDQRNWDLAVLFFTTLAAFLARHPLTLLVKVRTGRRATRDFALELTRLRGHL